MSSTAPPAMVADDGTSAGPVVRRIAGVAVPLLLVVVGTVVSWLRLPPAARSTLWAEDGRNFIGDRIADGPIAGLLTVYEGYFHVVPRIIADLVVSLLPVDRYAVAMSAASCVVVGLVTALVYVTSRSVVPGVVARVVVASITFLVPSASIEVLGNTANLHWYFIWAAPWMLLSEPRTRRSGVLLGVVMLAAGLTEIQLILFVPLVLLAWRRPFARPMCVALVLSVGAQVAATLLSPRTENTNAISGLDSIAIGYLLNAVGGTIAATTDGVKNLVADAGLLPFVLTLLVAVAAAVYLVVRGDLRERVFAVTAAAASAGIWVAAVTLNPQEQFEYAQTIDEGLPTFVLLRYAVVPSMFLLAVTVVAASRLWRERGPVRLIAPLLAVLVVAVQLSGVVTTENRRHKGPIWSVQVDQAETACLSIDPSAVETIRTAPERRSPPSPWNVMIECDDLLDGRVE